MTDMTDRERIERLEWALSALTGEVTKHFPLRNRPAGQDELNAIFKEVQAGAADQGADARRRILESELAELGVAR